MDSMTEAQLTTAVEFVKGLVARGVTYEALAAVTDNDERLDEITETFGIDRGYASRHKCQLTPVRLVISSDRRVVNMLMREGIEYLEELSFYTEDDVRALRGIGEMSLELIKGILENRGMSLRMPSQSGEAIAVRVYGTGDSKLVAKLLGRDERITRIWKE